MSENLLDEIKIREYLPIDEQFIYSTWMKLYFTASPYTRRIEHMNYCVNQRMIIDKIMSKCTEKWVASYVKDDGTLFGYLIGDKVIGKRNCLHFLFVKATFRNFGIARSLLTFAGFNNKPLEISHWIKETEQKLKPIPIYNPYRAMTT